MDHTHASPVLSLALLFSSEKSLLHTLTLFSPSPSSVQMFTQIDLQALRWPQNPWSGGAEKDFWVMPISAGAEAN